MNKDVYEPAMLHTSSEAIRLQSTVESNARTYVRTFDVNLTRGEGSLLFDAEGNQYIDCLAGAGTLATGHNHPLIISYLKSFLDGGHILHSLDMLTSAKRDYTQALFELLPEAMRGNSKVQFCGPSGADATEAAIKLFKTATGRSSIVSFHGGYHGMTCGAMSVTGNLAIKSPVASLMPDVHFFPYPYDYRSPYGAKGEALVDISLTHLRSSLSDPESGITKPAAVIVEAVQGEGGCIAAPIRWLKGLSQICKELDIPLILDEIQAGFGRTGKMFAFEHAQIQPDAILLSKAAGGGQPIALVIYHEKYDQWQPGSHTGTFRGNQLAMVAGLATFKLLNEESLAAQAQAKGIWLQQQLRRLQREYPVIGDIRGRGLMVGAEIINPNGTLDYNGNPLADGDLAFKIKRQCFKKGLIIETGGRDGAVLRFLPALTIEQSLLERTIEILEGVLASVTA